MNNSTPASITDESSSCPLIVPILFTVVLGVISIAAFAGNILVTVTVAKTPCLRTSTNYYIANVAISDLLCALITWPLYATDKVLSGRRSILQGSPATIGCKLGIYLRMVSHIVSIFSLVLIAVDRFIAIVVPFKASLVSAQCRAALMILTWIISLAVSFPVFYHTRMVVEDNFFYCKNTWDASSLTIYYSIGFVCIFVAPLVAIIILYSRVMKTLRKRETTNGLRDNVQSKRQKQNKNIMKIFKSIVVAFFVCWTPFCVYIFLNITYPKIFLKDSCNLIVGLFYYLFPSLSTTVNPVILFSFSTSYRQRLKTSHCWKNFRLCFKCRSRRPCKTFSSQNKDFAIDSIPELQAGVSMSRLELN